MRPLRHDGSGWIEPAAAARPPGAARLDAPTSDLFSGCSRRPAPRPASGPTSASPLYDTLDAIYERMWKQRLRRRLLRRARGRVLDVGVGTGCNLPHYPAGVEVVGVDLSRRMLAQAAQRATALNRRVHLAQMNLLQLDFPDRSFDTLVATFVLPCLPETLQGAACGSCAGCASRRA